MTDPTLVELAKVQLERDALRLALGEALDEWQAWCEYRASARLSGADHRQRIAELRKLVTP